MCSLQTSANITIGMHFTLFIMKQFIGVDSAVAALSKHLSKRHYCVIRF